MKKFNKIVLNMILLCFLLRGHDSFGYGLRSEAETIKQGMVEVATIVTPAIENASTTFGSDAAGKVAAVGDKFAVISGAAVCVVAVVQTASLVKDLGAAVFPSNEQKARELEYADKYNYLLKKKELNDCLVKNAYHKKGLSGLPSICEETAEMFALAAGDDEEFNKLVNVFKNVIRNQ